MKQNASARHHKRQLLARAASFGARHKIITALSVCIIVLATAIGWLWYANYSQKFSKEDFDQLTTMAKGVLEKTSGAKIYTDYTCRYRHGEFITIPSLECSIEAVAYLPYASDQNAISVAHSYEQNIRDVFSMQVLDFGNIYQHPNNASGSALVNSNHIGNRNSCNFGMDDNSRAENAVTFLPEKTSDNLIALSFECGGPSRAAYFQMVD